MDGAKRTRPLLPKPIPRKSDSPKPIPPAVSRKASKALAACEGCRRRKCRCDGARPTCGPCIAANTECRYKVPAGMSRRDADKHEAQQASKANQDLRIVLDLLRRTTDLGSADLLRRIKDAPTLDFAVGLIADASILLPDGDGRSSRPSPERKMDDMSPISTHSTSASFPSDVSISMDGEGLPVTLWTHVSKDNEFLNYLLGLFWTWDIVASRLIHQSLFLQSLRLGPGQDANTSYCSSFLVNAVLAISFIYLKQLYVQRGLDDLDGFGRYCADASFELYRAGAERPCVPTMQGLALLWIYEFNLGDASRAAYLLEQFYLVHEEVDLQQPHVHRAPSAGLSDEQLEAEGVSFVAWGVYCLESKIALMSSRPAMFTKPSNPREFPSAGPMELSNMVLEDQPWFPYPKPAPLQLSFHRDFFDADCDLAEIIDDSLHFIHTEGHSGMASFRRIQAFYDRLVAWRTELPQRLLINEGQHPLITFLHATYDAAAIKLLQLTARQSILGLDSQDVGTTIATHATALVSSLWVYRVAHGLRHDYWLASACFTAAAALVDPARASAVHMQQFVRACELLDGMARYLPAADRSLLTLGGMLLRKDEGGGTSTGSTGGSSSGSSDGAAAAATTTTLPEAVQAVLARVVARRGTVTVVNAAVMMPRANKEQAGLTAGTGTGTAMDVDTERLEYRDVQFSATIH